jgi:hypothetical protein
MEHELLAREALHAEQKLAEERESRTAETLSQRNSELRKNEEVERRAFLRHVQSVNQL